jgi:hypothetical protein
MRPLLALAILLIGLTAATAEGRIQDSIPPIRADQLPGSFTLENSVATGDRESVVAMPTTEASDGAHHQDDGRAAAPQPPAPASADDAQADADVADSLDGLCKTLMTSAEDYDLPVTFFANLIWQESGLRHDAVSKAGALGIAQFMPHVAAEEGVGNPFDPRQALPASARLLHTLREQFGNLGFVAAAYNAGAHRVGEWLDRGRALPRETRTYVLRVTGRTVEAWRKSPVDDSKLTFVKRLPCRELPEFAELEQSRLQDTSPDDQAQPDKDVAKTVAKARKARPWAHHAGREAAATVARKIVRYARKREAIHRPRALHERHRIAWIGGDTTDQLS